MGGVSKVPAKQSKVKRRITMSPPFEAREYTPNGCQAEKSKSFFVRIRAGDTDKKGLRLLSLTAIWCIFSCFERWTHGDASFDLTLFSRYLAHAPHAGSIR